MRREEREEGGREGREERREEEEGGRRGRNEREKRKGMERGIV